MYCILCQKAWWLLLHGVLPCNCREICIGLNSIKISVSWWNGEIHVSSRQKWHGVAWGKKDYSVSKSHQPFQKLKACYSIDVLCNAGKMSALTATQVCTYSKTLNIIFASAKIILEPSIGCDIIKVHNLVTMSVRHPRIDCVSLVRFDYRTQGRKSSSHKVSGKL